MLSLLGAGQSQNGGLTLSLDWSVSDSLVSPQGVTVNYTRPSRAMYFNTLGNLIASDENVFLWSEDLDNPVWIKDVSTIIPYINDLPNLPNVTKAWTLLDNSTNGEHRIYQSFGETIVGRNYTIAFVAKDFGRAVYVGSNSANFGIQEWAVFDLRTGIVSASGSASQTQVTSIGGGWYKCTVTMKCTGVGTASAYICTAPYGWNTRVASYVGDGISGIRITACSANMGGVISYNKSTSTPFYAPRFEYDPFTLTKRGLKVEGGATNLSLQSAEYSGSSWVRNGVTAGYTNETAGIGGNPGEAQKIVEDASGTAFIEQNPMTGVANTVYCVSHFIKRGNFDWIRLLIQDSTGTARAAVWFNINSGTIGSSGVTAGVGGVQGYIDKCQNGFFRIAMCANIGNYTSYKFTIVSAQADNNTNRVNNGYYYMSGSQFELGSYPTSYIYTRLATATRAADLLSIPVGNWFNKYSGSWVIDYMLDYINSGSGYGLIFASDGTANNRLYVRANNFGGSKEFVSIVSSTITSALSIGGILPKTAYKLSVSYGSTGFTMIPNNGTIYNNPPAALPPSISDITLGCRTGGQEFLQGWLRGFKNYNIKIDDNTLKIL